ncbi:MAG TPA: choice-of-anchor D domain-containing protein [Polyangiaceae bacterium]
MHSHARSRGRRLRVVSCVVVVGASFMAAVVACSSSSSQPPELGGPSNDAAIDHSTHEAAVEAAPPDTGPDVVEAASDADAGCTAGDAGVAISPTALTFGDGGLVGCGTQATPQSVTLTNNGCEPFNFTAQLTGGSTSYFTIIPTSGTVAPGQPETVEVNPVQIPANATPTTNYGGTLTITTTAPGNPTFPVALNQIVYGAILSSPKLFGQQVDFAGVPIGETRPLSFSISNGGNGDVSLALSVGSTNFAVTDADGGPATVTVAQGQPPVSVVVTFSPTQVEQYSDTLTTTVTSGAPVCTGAPGNASLTGAGTVGVSIQPTNQTLDFGNVQCGTPAAAPQTITITNTGPTATYTPTFALGANSPYTLADTSNNPITPGQPYPLGSSVSIQVVPKQITLPANTAAGGYDDTLTIATTASQDQPHAIALKETAQGAIFTLSPATISTSAAPGQTVFPTYQVGNIGNLSAGFTLAAATTVGAPNTFTPNLTSGNLAQNVTENGVLSTIGPPQTADGGNQQYLGTLTLTPVSGTVLCADVPPPMPLSVTSQ